MSVNTTFSDTIFNVGTALTAPGNGNTIQVAENNLFSTSNYTLITIVASINTSVNVSLEGSIDGTSFAPIIASTQYTANGTYSLSVSGRPVKFIRPVFVSEAGGTAATVTFHVAAA
jgi:hypothetical protein